MTAARTRPSWARQVLLVLGKDLAIELSTREIVTTSGFFAVLVLVITSMSFYVGPETSRDVAAGAIWVAIAFAAVLALGRTWQREREDGALAGLLVMPVSRSALFAGKALGVAAFLFFVELLVLPLAAIFFNLDLGDYGLGLLVLLLGATPGIAASGTLFGAMTVKTRARELVLASVLFPMLMPTLLAAAAGTRELLHDKPLSELGDYLMLMGVFASVFIAGGIGLFDTLIEG